MSVAQLPSTDFSQSYPDWEKAVFKEAIYFTVILFMGRGEYVRREYTPDQFPEAVAFALSPSPNGRPYLMYAVNALGRRVCLERRQYALWQVLWEQLRQPKAGR